MKAIAVIFICIALAIFFLNPFQKDEVDFNTQIRPILNKKCISCHGGVKKQEGVSFLFREEALAPAKSGIRPIVPGNPDSSGAWQRIIHPDPEVRMPPEGEPLSKEEQKLIFRWIKQGAKWKKHWAFIPPNKEITPPTSRSSWAKNDIDQFVLRKLNKEGIQPSKEAEKADLLRRVSLDLTGLPPSKKLIDSYLNDDQPDAYETLIEQLLASPHFGERWASMWLDLARYADSKGYQKDRLRKSMWLYRDWVIDALNKDMPFDQFTVEQLAGDLLPQAKDDQILATAFHRNTMTNDEGGTDDEEFRIAAVIDRLNTTMEIWQGITISCVQCHSHPYDPIRHEEFYQLYAFFNNSADADKGSDAPKKALLSAPQIHRKEAIQTKIESFKVSGDTLSEAYQKLVADFLAIQPLAVPIMEELEGDAKRKNFIFERGNWLVHGDEVAPNVPGCLNSMPEKASPDRLGLAHWLVDDQNPLTTRVIVNRFWEQLFGLGLVETLEDFGTQGMPPSHPELLDWLAVQFRTDFEWSIKSLLKEIVLSATYRQSSTVSPELYEKDPYNRLLARGPRFRLSAEQIRDQALAVSGLLSEKVYGPSVMPYQPDGVWNVIRHTDKWMVSEGADRYRRGLYTFWRRVSPYPSMITFDVPSRELCVSRRIRTNTPLQAFVTLNDPVFTEAAEALAERMKEEGGENIQERLVYGYQLAMSKTPDEQRLEALLLFFEETLKAYQSETNEIKKLIKKEANQTAEMAALINVANVILNLDEFVMKG